MEPKNKLRSLKAIYLKIGIVITNLLLAASEGMIFAEIIRLLLFCLTSINKEKLDFLLLIMGVFVFVYFLLRVLEDTLSFQFQRYIQTSYQDEILERYLNSQDYSVDFMDRMTAQMMTTLPIFATDKTSFFRSFARQTFLILFSSLYIFSVNPIILIAGLGLCIFLLLIFHTLTGKITQRTQDYLSANEQIYVHLKEQIRYRDLASYLNNERVTGNLEEADQKMLSHLLKLKKISNFADLSAVAGSLFLVLIAAVLGGFFVLQKKMTVQDLTAMLIVIPNLSSGLFSLPSLLSRKKQVEAQHTHIENFMASHHFIVNEGNSWCPEQNNNDGFHALTVKELSYSSDQGKVILSSISASFDCGQMLCLTGPSGCGKSTLLNIIGRQLSNNQQKTVYWGVRPVESIHREDFWKRILILNNNQPVLEQTLAFNITLSTDRLDLERLKEAIELADMKDWFKKNGENFQLKLHRNQLSSGERQKLSMARFFYRNCLGGLFDETTSAMDSSSEERIIQNLLKWVHEDSKRFVLMITHRRNSLQYADKIYYMEQGMIKAQGTHQELMGLVTYRRLLEGGE